MNGVLRSALGAVGLLLVMSAPGDAQELAASSEQTSNLMRTAALLTLFAFIPALLISTTSFIRIAIVLAMVRHAFGMPETPPNQVLIALALMLTAFIMGPTVSELNLVAIQPLLDGSVTVDEALSLGSLPLRDFMLSQVRDEDLAAVYALSNTPLPTSPEEVEFFKLVPAFIINELRIAFTIGFVVLLPFLLIELIVASILLSLGMMMVPPATISLPIKVLVFVLIDGWSLVVFGVVGGFQ
ncbi:flagellar type III secretion system pore protein FliP [Maricaulis sp. D1M11]|uniref:flagellar type III secretion system pore protein FliP n=1 Tax=Maricaulis sp. D1M11 TaxID=3076117 RepID=UPI0039B492B2